MVALAGQTRAAVWAHAQPRDRFSRLGVNHRTLQAIADRRGIPFIPSVEISTSWAHFNAYPLRLGEPLGIDTSRANIDQVLGEARRLGAQVVQINHPFIPYGYFASLDAGLAPGRWNPGFDLVEVNAANFVDDGKVLAKLAAFWNQGDRYYLSAGTDTHDVWNTLSGSVRMFAHVEGPLTPATFAAALKAGHAYATYGPLIFPEHMFGDDLKVVPGAPVSIGFDLKAVDGLKSAALVGKDGVVATQDLSAAGRETHVAGTLYGKQGSPRIVGIDDHVIDVPPSAHMVVVRNSDVPGIIGKVGMILGDAKVNIDDMVVGRTNSGQAALMALSTTTPVTDDVIAALRAEDGILDARAIELG